MKPKPFIYIISSSSIRPAILLIIIFSRNSFWWFQINTLQISLEVLKTSVWTLFVSQKEVVLIVELWRCLVVFFVNKVWSFGQCLSEVFILAWIVVPKMLSLRVTRGNKLRKQKHKKNAWIIASFEESSKTSSESLLISIYLYYL